MDCEAHSSARASHHYIRILALPASQKSKHRFWGSTSKTLRTSPLTPDSRLCVCFVYVSLLRQPGLLCFSDVFSWGFLGCCNGEVKIASRRKRFLARQRWFLKMNADGSCHGQSARRLKCTTHVLEVGFQRCIKMLCSDVSRSAAQTAQGHESPFFKYINNVSMCLVITLCFHN